MLNSAMSTELDPAAPQSSPRPGALRDVIKAIRPYQWVKNLLLFVPILMAHQLRDGQRLTHVLVGFAAFCLCASASYVLNDLWDREHDRHHPVKRNRPFAAGRLSTTTGALIALVLFGAGLSAAVLLLPVGFTAMLLLYVVITTAYSMWLKRKLLLDVFFLAGL